MYSTTPACRRSCAICIPARSRSSMSRPRWCRRSPPRCCSTTSPPTCTRATRRMPAPRRRAVARPDLLRELLGPEELRELIDPAALERVREELQAAPSRPGHRPRRAARDLLRLGDLSAGVIRYACWRNRLLECSRVGARTARDRGCAWTVSGATSPPTTRASTATRSAPSRPVACPRPSSLMSPTVCSACGALRRRHPRAVHDRGLARALRRGRRGGPARARARRAPRPRRDRARRQRPGMVRCRGAQAPAPRLAGGIAQRDRACRPERAGELPAGLARR